MVISVFSNLEIGQFDLASSAASAKLSAVAPGTLAVTSKCALVIAPLSKVIVQVVFIASGVRSLVPNTKLSFILKQPACAAATSSSGFVPIPSAKRVLHEYWFWFNTPDCVER